MKLAIKFWLSASSAKPTFFKLAKQLNYWEIFGKCSCATAIVLNKKCFKLTFAMQFNVIQDFLNEIPFQ